MFLTFPWCFYSFFLDFFPLSFLIFPLSFLIFPPLHVFLTFPWFFPYFSLMFSSQCHRLFLYFSDESLAKSLIGMSSRERLISLSKDSWMREDRLREIPILSQREGIQKYEENTATANFNLLNFHKANALEAVWSWSTLFTETSAFT